MLKIKKILFNHASDCENLLNTSTPDLKYFKRLGWSFNQFKLQILKEINYGLGIFNGNNLDGFLLGGFLLGGGFSLGGFLLDGFFLDGFLLGGFFRVISF